MKIVNAPINNMGGIAKVLAIPGSAFERLEFGDDVHEFCPIFEKNEAILFDCIVGGFSFQENKKESDAGDTYETAISGVLLDVSEEVLQVLQHNVFVVAHIDRNGKAMITGGERCQMVFEYKQDTSNSFAGLNAISFSFSSSSDTPSVLVDKSIFGSS